MSPSKFHLVLIVASNFQASLKLSCDYAALWHDSVILSLWFPGDNAFEVSYSSQVNVPKAIGVDNKQHMVCCKFRHRCKY